MDELGKQRQPILFSIPEIGIIDLQGAAGGPDGTLAVCGVAFDKSHGPKFAYSFLTVGD